jgi:hypothetical protein
LKASATSSSFMSRYRLYICTEVQPSVHANGAAGALNLASKNQIFNPRAIPIGVGRGIGAEIRQAGFGCDDRGPFDRSSRLSVGIRTHWNYNGDDDDD